VPEFLIQDAVQETPRDETQAAEKEERSEGRLSDLFLRRDTGATCGSRMIISAPVIAIRPTLGIVSIRAGNGPPAALADQVRGYVLIARISPGRRLGDTSPHSDTPPNLRIRPSVTCAQTDYSKRHIARPGRAVGAFAKAGLYLLGLERERCGLSSVKTRNGHLV
jgi:hypothetical protein